MTLDQWLAIATRHLAQSSVERVRTEIQQHVEEAQAAGADPIQALGDPRTANRGYRKVLLTETEEALAPSYTGAAGRSLSGIVIGIVVLLPAIAATLKSRRVAMPLPLLLAMFSLVPLNAFWPANTLERTRKHIYIHAIRWAVVVAIAWWLQGQARAIILGTFVLAVEYWTLGSRFAFFRKSAAGQVVLPMPGEPRLTHNEAIFLRTSQRGVKGQAWAIALNTLVLAGLAVWQPWTVGPTFVVWVGHFAARYLPIADPRRSELYRRVKWSAMLLASILPFVWHAPAPWAPSILWAFVFLLIDTRRITLRRKLPVAEWPQDLYL